MTIQIEMPSDEKALTEFVRFHDRVYEYRAARWPVAPRRQLHILTRQPPYESGREIQCFVARERRNLVARAAAIVDHFYLDHWKEPLGHLMMFEALPESTAAVEAMIEAACEWLHEHGMRAVRAGTMGLLDAPFALDDYDTLPPRILRQNPGYYHALLKDAGFETEKGWIDYKIEATPALIERYGSAIEVAQRGGFRVMPVKDVALDQRVGHFTSVWNNAFQHHWGMVPRREIEVAAMFRSFASGTGLDTSVIAYRGEEPVGALVALGSSTGHVLLAPGRAVRQSEKLNWLGIGVHESARGRGVNLAMASYTFLELIRLGAKYLSYTLVLDDNWPSRRTAEKLGAKVCANYLTYRRDLR
jgi:hypothetical protein